MGFECGPCHDARELMIGQTTVPGVRTLVEEVENLSLDVKRRCPHAAAHSRGGDRPRGGMVPARVQEQTVVEGLSGPARNSGCRYPGREKSLPSARRSVGRAFPCEPIGFLWGMWGQDLVRWLLFTEGTLPIVDQEVVLWVASQP